MQFGVVCHSSFVFISKITVLLTEQLAVELNNFPLTGCARSRSFIRVSPAKNKFQFQRAN